MTNVQIRTSRIALVTGDGAWIGQTADPAIESADATPAPLHGPATG